MQQLDQFNTERAIVEAILAEEARPGRADSILERARRLDCDPLKVLIHEVQADQDEIYRRLAGLLGLRFSADIAPFIEPFGKDANVDAFGSLTTVAGRMRGAEVLFAAPGLRQAMLFARLGARAERIIVTSPRSLSSAIASVNADRLIEESIQRTIRQYPNCCANTESRKSHRLALVAVISGIMLAAFLAPAPIRLVLFPILTAALFAPSLFRLWAAATAPRNIPLGAPDLLGDEDLPVYTVLVPLRDEAHMVPQMARALSRLDYPALWRKHILRPVQQTW